MQADPRQATGTVMMIRPLGFGFNPETAATNVFQHQPVDDALSIRIQAINEFDHAASQLRAQGIDVLVFDDTLTPHTPDAVFPNNWISFHASGQIILYPMMAASRRAEVRMDIVEQLAARFDFRVIDLRDAGLGVLEGTGSLVFDHLHRIAYAARSERTNDQAVHQLAQRLGYQCQLFDALDEQGTPLYHTNVMLCVGDRFAVVCLDSLVDVQARSLQASLESTGHEVIAISQAQMRCFAGNMLQLRNTDGESLLALSVAALASLQPPQVATLEQHSRLIPIPLPTIERCGGGSIRCMLAEVFLPQNL